MDMPDAVTPRELAQRLGIDPKQVRAWLRQQANAEHEVLRRHQHQDRWSFTASEANQLVDEYRRGGRHATRSGAGHRSVPADHEMGVTPAASHAPRIGKVPHAAQVATSLSGPPVAARDVQPAAVPATSGLYAWWAADDVLPDLQYLPDGGRHPTSPRLVLLYVGISSDLRSRITRKHLGSSTGGSTLRRALAALLSSELDLTACWSPNRDRVTLQKPSEARLTEWMRSRLHVSWAQHPSPKSVEADVIKILGPPCNVDHNEHHPNYERMVSARVAWRVSAGSPG
jgi:hypothetical protein